MSELPTSEFFEITRDGAVVELRLNRPQKANAMDAPFWRDLPQIMQALDDDESVRAVVISGEGKHFSAGIDLTMLADVGNMMNLEAGRAAHALRKLILWLQDAFNSLERARMPVIAAIHGSCLGGAVDFITACDIRLATRDAKFSVEEINVGMTADVGTLQRLPKLIPFGVAMELAMTGRRFSAEEAQSWGLVSSLYDDAEAVRAAALEMAQGLARKSPLALSGIKRTVLYARDHAVGESLEQIAMWNAAMLRPDDLMKAMQAKMMKQDAEFDDLLAASYSKR